jgi:hypothetical protein
MKSLKNRWKLLIENIWKFKKKLMKKLFSDKAENTYLDDIFKFLYICF